jgi:hypothetical protein
MSSKSQDELDQEEKALHKLQVENEKKRQAQQQQQMKKLAEQQKQEEKKHEDALATALKEMKKNEDIFKQVFPPLTSSLCVVLQSASSASLSPFCFSFV